jgi:hypothetical protein
MLYPQFHGPFQSSLHFVEVRIDAPKEMIRRVSQSRAGKASLCKELYVRKGAHSVFELNDHVDYIYIKERGFLPRMLLQPDRSKQFCLLKANTIYQKAQKLRC